MEQETKTSCVELQNIVNKLQSANPRFITFYWDEFFPQWDESDELEEIIFIALNIQQHQNNVNFFRLFTHIFKDISFKAIIELVETIAITQTKMQQHLFTLFICDLLKELAGHELLLKYSKLF